MKVLIVVAPYYKDIADNMIAGAIATLEEAGNQIREAGITLHAGHGLTYRNVVPVARIEGMHELNIGHSIVSRAIMVGFERAVREMKNLVT